MVKQPTARQHRSRIAYAFGLLALVGAATALMVTVRDPALSSARLTAPVPAPEITVVEYEDPVLRDEVERDPYAADEDLDAPVQDSPASGRPAADEDGAQAAPHSPEDVRRSLFWSGVFGLAISLAGLGLVGTRRRMW